MLNDYGYFSTRDVYPTYMKGLSTRESTKIESNDNNAPVDVIETNKVTKIDNVDNQGNIIKSLGILVIIVLVVSRFGK